MKRWLAIAVLLMSGVVLLGASRGNLGSAKALKALEHLYGSGMFGTAGAAVVQEGLDGMHRTVFDIRVNGATNTVTLADGAHGGGTLLYTFPEGEVYIVGGILNATVTNTNGFNANPNDTFSFGIGTVVGADDDALTLTEQDIVGSATVDTTGGTVLTRTVTGGMTTPAMFDGTTTAVALYVNFAVAAANNSASNDFTCTGTLTLVWSHLGDM